MSVTMEPGLRLYAVGDIHGRLDLLDPLLAKVREDVRINAAEAERVRLVFLGDYVDRGVDSRGVIDRLIELRSARKFEIVCLKGNHEDIALRFMAGEVDVGPLWVMNGGGATMQSYGVDFDSLSQADPSLQRCRDALNEAMPDAHKTFMASLSLDCWAGDYFFCHGGVKPGVPLEEQKEEDLIWIRYEFLNSDVDFGAVVVHGHTPVPEPEIRPNRIGIDTGAGHGRYLTAAVFCGSERSFLFAGREDS